jgi:UDP-N-acetylglucosamine--N-acetylmuramyl-(pentapeptide) pyrophosphoryl-undecaprenol N-acetylglucosamine transferase
METIKNASPTMKILIAAGGSGGHLLPAQQLAALMKSDGEVLFAGHRLDSSPFFQRGHFPYQAISAAPLCWSPKGLYVFFREMLSGMGQSLRLIRRFSPDVVVGFGSFHSFPVLLAAVLLRRPLVLFEANCCQGKVNRLFAPMAKKVAVQFLLKKAPMNQCFVPLLPWGGQPALPDKMSALKELGLSADRTTFLVFGGSQGASFLNRAIPLSLPRDAQVIHLTGNEESALRVAESYRLAGLPAVVKGFESNMQRAYAAADFAICRSGAGTIAELVRYSIPALLIPFPFAADDHQRINAEFLAKKIRGAKMVDERLADEATLSKEIKEMRIESEHLRDALSRFRFDSQGRVGLREQILELGKKP